MEKMTGTPADLRTLVEQCLDNQPSRRPPISDVSERMKEVECDEVSTCQHEPYNMAAGRADNQDVKGSHNNCTNS